MRYGLVMPAAGVGRRFGEDLPKQYQDLCGRAVVEWALAPFLADTRCERLVVAVSARDPHWPRVHERLRAAHDLRVHVVTGGAERADSVRLALAELRTGSDADRWVLVHDAARPCLDAADLDGLLRAGVAHGSGALLATPLADTLKREWNATAAQTIPRSSLWCAQTPQMFRLGALLDALEAARRQGRTPTDESQAMEWLGVQPALVAASAPNPKITTRADLCVARALLGNRTGVAA